MTTIIFPDNESVNVASIPDGVDVVAAIEQLTTGEYRIVDPTTLPDAPIETWVWGNPLTVDYSRVTTQPKWEIALIAIHTGLASESPNCPFCQIRLWADNDLTLDARVRDFTQAFLQPDIVKLGAVQAGLNRVWAALSTTQQSQLNTTDLNSWDAANNLGLTKPWEVS